MAKLRSYLTGSLVLALVLALLSGSGAWWYRVTRPEYRLLRGQQALHRGDLVEAERVARQLVADGYPDFAHLVQGEALMREQRYPEAVNEFDQIQDRGEIYLQAYTKVGRCLLEVKQPREAAGAWQNVLAQRPEDVEAHRGLAVIYYDQGAMTLAVPHLQEVARLDCEDGRPYRLMGLIHKDLSQDVEAMAAYKEALRRRLSYDQAEAAREELAQMLVKHGDYQEALSVLDACDEEAADKPAGTALRAESLWALGKASEAAALLERALTGHPDSPELLRLRGRLYLDAGDAAAAARSLEQALKTDRHDHVSHQHLAQAYGQMGRRTDAAEQLRLAEQTRQMLDEMTNLNREAMQKPWDPLIRLCLAKLCEKLNKPAMADRWRHAAAACPPLTAREP